MYFKHSRRSARWLLCALVSALLGFGASHAHALSPPLCALLLALANGLLYALWPRSSAEGECAETAKVRGVAAGAHTTMESAFVVAAVAAEPDAVVDGVETSESEGVGAEAAACSPHSSSGAGSSRGPAMAPSGATIVRRRTAAEEAAASAAAVEDPAAAAAAAAAATTWNTGDGAYFSVRDRGYRKSKAKVPSAASLYEAIEVATFRFDAVEGNVAPRVFAGAVPPTYRNARERARRQRAGEALDAAGTTLEEAAHLDHLVETIEFEPAKVRRFFSFYFSPFYLISSFSVLIV